MTSHSVTVAPAGIEVDPDQISFVWPRKGDADANVISNLSWDLEEFAAASPPARDFYRIAAAAYLADSAVSKPAVSLHRQLRVTTFVEDPQPWEDGALTGLADLLHWLTGDSWALILKPEDARLPLQVAEPADRIQLLSGGLDSLCGAAIGLRDNSSIRFVGHRDASRAVRHAQRLIDDAIGDAPYDRFEFYLRDTSRRKNHGPRSRSLMFMALGAMSAHSHGARTLWVPENGFTSINPPLDAGRGGTLTTRSTHPYTFLLVSSLLETLGTGVEITNPFTSMTKGELVAAALPDLATPKFADALKSSFSCAKGGTQFHGGDSNHNCGLCVACVVRRGAFLGAGIEDPSDYDCELLDGSDLEGLLKQRWRDIVSLREAAEFGIPEELVLSSARWPRDTDFDGVMDLVRRGLAEIGHVQLPSP